jgi:hypothetical protein
MYQFKMLIFACKYVRHVSVSVPVRMHSHVLQRQKYVQIQSTRKILMLF